MQIIEHKFLQSIPVVAVILLNGGRFLISTRPKKKTFSGFWEFPGGKVKLNESKEEALVREIREEINVDLDVNSIIPFKDYFYSFSKYKVKLNFYFCKDWKGDLLPLEGQKIKWINVDDIPNYRFLPSNKEVLGKIGKDFTSYPTL